jgi:phenylalanyl-tRNA synthetase beta chain
MPNIEISKKDFERLYGKKLSEQALRDLLELTKAEVDHIEQDKVIVEIKDSNRIDLLSVEGLVRELKNLTGKTSGLKSYKFEKSDKPFTVIIDHKVSTVRPYTVCAVIKDLKFTEESILQIIQLQEKICEGMGKKRKEIALGIYDFDKIKWPISYTTYKPDSLRFTPLGFIEELSLKEILKKHEKGQIYGHLIENAKEYPIFIDQDKNVLSMPPIINSEYSGKVTIDTQNIFIEVSGFSEKKLSDALNIVVAAFAERGGKIYPVILKHGLKRSQTPRLESRTKNLTIQEINSLLGTSLKEKEIINLVKKAGYNVTLNKNELTIEIPFYRNDVLHKVDIIEDIAIAYGFKNLKPVEPHIATQGKILEETTFSENVSNLLSGLGFQEILNFNLSKPDNLFDSMNLEKRPVITLKNPMSENHTCLRSWLLPSSLEFLSQNTTKQMPQNIFELGKVFNIDERRDNKTKETNKISISLCNTKANFTEAKQVLDYIFQSLGKSYVLKPTQHQSFIPGRAAEIILNRHNIGIIGEVHPKVLNNWKLKTPVASIEIDLDMIRE